MNENLQNALVEILNKAISGIDTSVEFMQAELPDVIEQLLAWYAVKSAMYSIFGLIIIVSYLVLWKRWIDKCKEESSSPDVIDTFVLPLLFGAIPIMAASLLFDLSWLKILIAPKIWLMEYAADLVK